MSDRIYEIKDRLREAMNLSDKISADLTRDLGIPSSAMSQYLSGKSKSMPIDRLHDIAKYLNVSEVWLMGYDVSMDRTQGINADSKGDDPDPLSKQLLASLASMTMQEKEELLNYIKYIISKRPD